MDRITGTVKWFSDQKGYGFLAQDDGPDVFVHHTAIEGSGYKTLQEGEKVEFSVIQESQGPKAQNVVRLDPPSPDIRGGPMKEGGFQPPTDESPREFGD